MAEAEMAIELFEAIQEEAALEAAEAIVLSEVLRAAAARQAAHALVAAELIEGAAWRRRPEWSRRRWRFRLGSRKNRHRGP
jgi:hypothetical protein